MTNFKSTLESEGKFLNLLFVLVLRLSRTGKRNQPAYRMVVAEHSSPIQSKFVDIVGYYNPAEKNKINFQMDRIEHWIKMGAKPSQSLASLLKKNSVPNMDKFIAPRTQKRKKKGAPEEVAAAPAAEAPVAEAPVETPAQ